MYSFMHPYGAARIHAPLIPLARQEFYGTYRVIVPAIIREEVLQKTVKRLNKNQMKSQCVTHRSINT